MRGWMTRELVGGACVPTAPPNLTVPSLAQAPSVWLVVALIVAIGGFLLMFPPRWSWMRNAGWMVRGAGFVLVCSLAVSRVLVIGVAQTYSTASSRWFFSEMRRLDAQCPADALVSASQQVENALFHADAVTSRLSNIGYAIPLVAIVIFTAAVFGQRALQRNHRQIARETT